MTGVFLIAALSFFAARDDSTTAVGAGPGRAVPQQTGALGARLRAGNVELRYGDERARTATEALARDVAGVPDPALAAAGQEVRAVSEPGVRGIRALAWRRELRATDPRDPALREFVEHWLGRSR